MSDRLEQIRQSARAVDKDFVNPDILFLLNQLDLAAEHNGALQAENERLRAFADEMRATADLEFDDWAHGFALIEAMQEALQRLDEESER